MRLVQLLGLWTAASLPVSVLVGVFLHAGQAGRPVAAPVVADRPAR
jgi:hypothetical protein